MMNVSNWHEPELHLAKLPSTKRPVATGSFWHVVAGHDRQFSCWIFYTSTGEQMER